MQVKKILKIIGIIATILLAGSLAVFFWKEKQEEKEREAIYIEMEKALKPLEQEMNQLKGESDALELKYVRESKGLGSVEFLFTNLDQTVYTDIYPQMGKYDFVGMLTLSAEQVPDKEGCLTQEQFEELLEAGWTCCLKWEEGTSTSVWLSACDNIAEEIGIDRPAVVYFPAGTYTSGVDSFLKREGFLIAVHHGEEELPLVVTEVEEDIWHPGAFPWNQSGASQMLLEAISQKSNLIFTIGQDSSAEKYVPDIGARMLERIHAYCIMDELFVMDMMEAREYRRKLENNQSWLTEEYQQRKRELEEQIEELKKEIDEIIESYMIILDEIK